MYIIILAIFVQEEQATVGLRGSMPIINFNEFFNLVSVNVAYYLALKLKISSENSYSVHSVNNYTAKLVTNIKTSAIVSTLYQHC